MEPPKDYLWIPPLHFDWKNTGVGAKILDFSPPLYNIWAVWNWSVPCLLWASISLSIKWEGQIRWSPKSLIAVLLWFLWFCSSHKTGDLKRWENSFCLHYICLDRLFQEVGTPVPLSWCHTSSLCQGLRRCQLAPPQGCRYQMTLLVWVGIKSPRLGPWNTVSARCLQPCGWFFSCCCTSALRPPIRRQVRNQASRSKGPWPLVSFTYLFIH